jgi:uncharacterized protein YyaL (SSP411 family)
MPLMAANLALWHARRSEVVLAGQPGAPDMTALERAVEERYLPWAVRLTRAPGAAAVPRAPWLSAMVSKSGDATGYVCYDFTCQTPATDPAALGQRLDEAAAPRRIVLS